METAEISRRRKRIDCRQGISFGGFFGRLGLFTHARGGILWIFLFHAVHVIARAEETELGVHWVGNVYGTVVDSETGAPIAGAEVLLFQLPSTENPEPTAVFRHTESHLDGVLALPDRRGTTDVEGRFLINAVPTPFPFQDYRICLRAAGYHPMIIEPARVLPGAVMALCVKGSLSRGIGQPVQIRGTDRTAPLVYRHQALGGPGALPSRLPSSDPTRPVTHTIFATREGLVGGTTANGHLIQPRDRFVALPSWRALNANDKTTDFQVELVSGQRVVRAPVWDVGPWNTKDDYWNPAEIREMWPDLSPGMPEAQAAFQSRYHNGQDQYGRAVLNPAGIDLADGTFWDDLSLTENSWVTVTFLWRPGVQAGDRIQNIATALNVRDSPAGTVLGKQPAGAQGAIVGGPQGAVAGGIFYVWWQIQWEEGVPRGWCAENFLEKIPAQPDVARLEIGLAGHDPELTLHYQAGAILSIEASSDLGSPGSWVLLTNLPLSSATQSWRDRNRPVGLSQRFYRARPLGW